MNTVVVAGASGFIGRHLSKILSRNGYDVISVTRSQSKESPYVSEVKSWPQLHAEGLPPCKAVINLCGENIMQPKRWTPEYKAEIVSSRTASTNLFCMELDVSFRLCFCGLSLKLSAHFQLRKEFASVLSMQPSELQPGHFGDFASSGVANGVGVMDEIQHETIAGRKHSWISMLKELILNAKERPKAFIVASGVGYYTPSLTAEYDESSPGGTSDFFAQLTTAWEDAAQLPKGSGVRVANIRTGAVLGRDGGVFKSMYYPFFFGLGGPTGSGRQPFPWIHLDDLAYIYKHVMENDKCSGTYNAVAPQIITNKDFVNALGKAMHRPACFPVPEVVLNFLLNPERAIILTQGQKVHPKKTVDSGFGFLFPTIDEACEDLCMKAAEMPEGAA